MADHEPNPWVEEMASAAERIARILPRASLPYGLVAHWDAADGPPPVPLAELGPRSMTTQLRRLSGWRIVPVPLSDEVGLRWDLAGAWWALPPRPAAADRPRRFPSRRAALAYATQRAAAARRNRPATSTMGTRSRRSGVGRHAAAG